MFIERGFNFFAEKAFWRSAKKLRVGPFNRKLRFSKNFGIIVCKLFSSKSFCILLLKDIVVGHYGVGILGTCMSLYVLITLVGGSLLFYLAATLLLWTNIDIHFRRIHGLKTEDNLLLQFLGTFLRWQHRLKSIKAGMKTLNYQLI